MAKYPDVTAGQTEACINRMGGMQNFLRFIAGSGEIVFDSIFRYLRKVTLSAQPALTTSGKYFEDARVVWMSRNFQEQFFSLEVPSLSSADFIVRRLEQNSLDAPIIAELGGEEKAETSASHFTDFLKKNAGLTELLIFYLRGKDGNFWAVAPNWNAAYGGWLVNAYSVSSPREWGAGYRVVSSK